MHALTAIPALRDNYIWRLANEHGDYLLVDPGSPEVLQQLEHAPAAILITHLHRDHIDALAPLRQRWPDIPVFGPATLRQLVEDCQSVVHQQVIELAGFAPILVLEVPGPIRWTISPTWCNNNLWCFFVAIRCLVGVAVDCLKAQQNKCTHRYKC